MSVRADAESLRMVPIFRDCDPVALQVMAFASERQQFNAGESIIVEGLMARSAFFIMSGEAIVQARGDTVGLAEPGAMLGETAMIAAIPYAVTAVAQGPVTTARIDSTLFLRIVAEYPDFGQSVARGLSKRLEQSVRELSGVRDMLGRIKGFSEM